MRTCFIFGASFCCQLRTEPQPGDLVLAADGGYRHCLKLKIVPDLLLGDFDSLSEPPDFPHVLRLPVEKDDTDTMLAAKYGLEQGCDRFQIYGGTGGRLDHTLANLQLLLFLRSQGARGFLHDEGFVYTAISNESFTIARTVDWGLLSVFCFGAPAHGVWERGVQYPLENASLDSSFPLGVSNHIVEAEAQVGVSEGSLVLGWQL